MIIFLVMYRTLQITGLVIAQAFVLMFEEEVVVTALACRLI